MFRYKKYSALKQFFCKKMKTIKVVIVLQFTIITATNITETTDKIKSILTKYKNSRHVRCSSFDKTENFVAKAIKLVEKNAGFGEFFKGFNVSQCSLNKGADYVKRHVLDGLIVHPVLPDWHWHEYKVSFFFIIGSVC